MSRLIIVGYDGSPRSLDALALSGLLASATGGELVLVCVHDTNESISAAIGPNPVEQRLEDQARDTLARAPVEAFEQIPVHRQALADSSRAAALYNFAARERADLVVLGSTTHTRLGRVHPGSVAERLLNSAPCAVAVAQPATPTGAASWRASPLPTTTATKPNTPSKPRRLWRDAPTRSCALSTSANASPHSLAPTGSRPTPSSSPEVQRACEEQVAAAKARVADGLNVSTEVLEGDAVDVLADETLAGVDLLITGSRSYGPMHSLLVGGVSNELIRQAGCAILIVPRGVQLTFDSRSHVHGNTAAVDFKQSARR